MEAVHPNYIIVPSIGGRGSGWDITRPTNIKLLIHSNTTDGSTTFVDSVGTHSPTVGAATVEHDTDQHKFGKSSILFDGDSGYITIPDHADWFMDTGNFAVGLWAMPASVAAPLPLFYQYDGVNNKASFMWSQSSGNLIFSITAAGTETVHCSGAWSPSINTWHYLAVVRGWGGNANDWAVTVNGTAVGTTTDSSAWHDIGGALWIGKYSYTPLEYYYNGWMDEILVVKGSTPWTTNFVPPYGAYT